MKAAFHNRFALVLTLAAVSSIGFAQQSTPPAQDPNSKVNPNPATKPVAPPSEEIPDSPSPQASALVHPNGPMVVFDTSMGRITCQFYQQQAPKTVANFIALAEGTKDWVDPNTHKKMHNKPLYDGTTFHRVIPQFMIQGGDPTGTGMGDPGYSFEDEFDPNLNFDVPGRLAMANSGPNTDGSQFFITEQAYDSLNQALHTLRTVRSGWGPGRQSYFPRAAGCLTTNQRRPLCCARLLLCAMDRQYRRHLLLPVLLSRTQLQHRSPSSCASVFVTG